jgi:hypothetical protein
MSGERPRERDTEAWFKELANRLETLGAKLEGAAILATRSSQARAEIAQQLSHVQELIAGIEDRLARWSSNSPRHSSADAAVSYRELEDFPGYRVGSDGTVWGSRRPGRGYGDLREWRLLKPYLLRPGPALTVSLYRDRVRHLMRVDALMLLAFVGPCPLDGEPRHRNGDVLDNRLENLRYVRTGVG